MEKSILLYGNVQLYPSDLQVLDKGRWINDTIIEFYYEYLEQSLDQKILLLRPCMVYLMIQSRKDELIGLKSCLPELSNRDLIFMPLNDNDGDHVGGTHWSLLVYNRQKYIHFDSLSPSNTRVASKLVKKLQMMIGLGELVNSSCPQQENGSDCGGYVMKFTEMILQKYSGGIKDWTNLDTIDARSVEDMRSNLKRLIQDLVKDSK